MDQVDNIIFQNFISLGWEKDEDVNSLKDLEVSTVANLMVKCLNAINNEEDLPQSLPHNMSQRFRVAAKIAESIKNLGYSGDLGYQSILYSNEADLRKIFTFLIEKLPKDAPTLSKDQLGKSLVIEKEASRKLKEVLQRPWIPLHCSTVAKKYKMLNSDDISPAQYGISQCRAFKSDKLMCHRICSQSYLECGDNKGAQDCNHSVFQCLPSTELLPTLLNSHSQFMGRNLPEFFDDKREVTTEIADHSDTGSSFKQLDSKGLRKKDLEDIFQGIDNSVQSTQRVFSEVLELTNSAEFHNAPTKAKESKVETLLKAKEEDQKKKLSEITHQIAELQEEVVGICREIKNKESSLDELQNKIKIEKETVAKEEERLILLKKTSSLTSDPENNLLKLKETLKANKDKEEKLLKQWLEFKKPLEEELEAAKHELSSKKSKQTEIENEVIDLKKATQCLLEEAKVKEALLLQLNEQKSKLNKGVNRSVYTKQILDVSAKVQKQKQEVKKILSDTRIIQKEINSLTGKLQRTFAVVEERSFKAASTNERARQIYRSVITIHEEFGALVEMTREIGSIQRETADLQQQLNSEKSKDIEDNLKRLQEDFNKLKMENTSLKQSLSS